MSDVIEMHGPGPCEGEPCQKNNAAKTESSRVPMTESEWAKKITIRDASYRWRSQLREAGPNTRARTDRKVRPNFHLRRHLANGSTKINRNSWYRVAYEARDAAQKANSEGDLYWDEVECTSDRCERRKNARPSGDGIRYT